MSIKDAVETRLTGSAELTAIVGTKIWFVEADRPDGSDKVSPPAVLFTLLEDSRLEALNYRRAVWRFDCIAVDGGEGKGTDQAQTIAAIVEALFDNYIGAVDGVRIRKSGKFAEAGTGVPSRDERVGNWFNAPVGVSLIYLD